MTRKKLPRVVSASSSDHYHGSERDTSLDTFVVEDASDLRLKTVDAIDIARKRILAKLSRDRRRKPASFDEKKYEAARIKQDAKRQPKNKFIKNEAEVIKPVRGVAQSASARLQGSGKGLSVKQSLRAFSAPVGDQSSNSSQSKASLKRHKTVTKNVVAHFRKQRELFKFAHKKDELEVTNPLTQFLYATGCLTLDMFTKSIASEDFTELQEYSNQIALRIYAGDSDEALEWLITMDLDQMKIYLAQIYDENIRHQNRTKTNQLAAANKLKWISFLFYLTSRCCDVSVDDFVELALALLEPSERTKLRPLLRSFDRGGANGRNFGLDYYVCTLHNTHRKKRSSASKRASNDIRSSNIVHTKRQRRVYNVAKSNALSDLRRAREAKERRKNKRAGSSGRNSRSRQMALKRKRSASGNVSTSRSNRSKKKKPRRQIIDSY